MDSTQLCEYSSTITAPEESSFTPARSSPRPRVFGMAADGEQHLVGVDVFAGGQRHAQRAAGLLDLRQRGLHGELDAGALGLDVQVRAQVVVEAAQHAIAAMHDARLGAEPVEDVGEFQRHVAAADDENAPREFLQQEGLVRGDAELEAGQAVE